MAMSALHVVLLFSAAASVITGVHDGCTARHHVEISPTVGAHHRLRLWHDAASFLSTPLLTVSLISGDVQAPHDIRHLTSLEDSGLSMDSRGYPVHSSDHSIAGPAEDSSGGVVAAVKWELNRRRLKIVTVSGVNRTSVSLDTTLTVPGGWNYFEITLFEPKSLSLLQGDNYVPLLSSLVGNEYHGASTGSYPVDRVRFSGSNITLDCYRGFTRWTVSGASTAIPLTSGDATWYRRSVSLHSANPFRPLLRLGSAEVVQLGWDTEAQTILANGSQPLPAKRLLKLFVHCEDAGSGNFLCQFLRSDETRLTEGALVASPLVMTATSASFVGSHFTVELTAGDEGNGGRQRAAEGAGHATTTAPAGGATSRGYSSFSAVLVTLLVIATLLLLVVLVLKLVFGATLVYKPKIKGLSWVVQSSSPPGDCELGVWPQQEEQDALLHETEEEASPKEDWRIAALWSAVSEGVPQRIPRLLLEGADPDAVPSGKETSSLQEAHLRADSVVLAAVRGSLDPPEGDVVRSLVPILKARIERVFTAALHAEYSGSEGVAVALQQSGVRATVRDAKGRSILHCALLEDPATGLPRWCVENIRKFLQDNTVLCNAVDFQGNTPLHTLASRDLRSDADDDNSVEAAWLACAEELLRRGADPTLPNVDGQNPLDIAQLHAHGRLLQLFSQHKPSSGRRSHLFKTAADAELEQCWALLKAACTGHEDTWHQLQARRGPPDQMLGGGCPLALSVMHEYYDVTSLLLSAGASPCGGRGLTALQVAHIKEGLPGLFAAQLRIACHDQLNWEASRAPQDIAWRLRTLSDLLLDEGPSCLGITDGAPDPKLPEQTNIEELVKLAEAGLVFSCQVFCQENPVCTYYRTNVEVDNPVEKAIKAGKTSLAVTLCRDTALTPFPEMSYKAVPSVVSDSLLLNDIKLLDDFLTSQTDSDDALFHFCYELKINGKVSKYPPLTAWKAIAKLGLQNIFHRIMDDHFLDVDSILDPSLGFTLLHYAAAYGQLPMIRTLKSLGYNLNQKAVHGATPYHLCLSRLHWECVEYFRSCEIKEGVLLDVTLVNMPLTELRIAALERINTLHVLRKDHILQLMCENNPKRRRFIMLNKMFPQLRRTNTGNLVQLYNSWAEESNRLLPVIKGEIENLLLKIATDCPAMKCSVQKCSFVKNVQSYTLEFVFHVEADKEAFVRHKYVENCNIQSLMLDTFQAVVSSATHDPRISCQEPSASFVYPYCKAHENGPTLYMVKHFESKLFRIKSLLIMGFNDDSKGPLSSACSSNSNNPKGMPPNKCDLINACLVLCSGQNERLSSVISKGPLRNFSLRDTVHKPLPNLNMQLAQGLLTLIFESHPKLWKRLKNVLPVATSTLTTSEDHRSLLQQTDGKLTSSRSDLLDVSSCTEEEDAVAAQNKSDESAIILKQSELEKLAWHGALVELLELAASAAGDHSNPAVQQASSGAARRFGLGDVKEAFAAASMFLHHLH